jgi:hypothetical protein
MIDYTIQLPEYLEFARRNTHGVRLNETEVISMERGLDNCLVELNKCYNATHTENMGTYEEGVRCNYAAYVFAAKSLLLGFISLEFCSQSDGSSRLSASISTTRA